MFCLFLLSLILSSFYKVISILIENFEGNRLIAYNLRLAFLQFSSELHHERHWWQITLLVLIFSVFQYFFEK